MMMTVMLSVMRITTIMRITIRRRRRIVMLMKMMMLVSRQYNLVCVHMIIL
jgi:hypothetical protein